MTDNCFCSRQGTLQRVAWGVVVLAAGAAAAPAQQKDPVPGEAAQATARELIREIYGAQHDEAKTSAAKTALAEKMLEQAANAKDNRTLFFSSNRPGGQGAHDLWTARIEH